MLRDGSIERDPAGYCLTYWRSVLHTIVSDPKYDEAALAALHCDIPNERPPGLLRRFGFVFGDIQKYDWREEARRISAQTLVIVAENDQTAPPSASREWATFIPNSRVLLFPQNGHYIFLERPDELLSALRTFLAGTWPAAAR
jgi:pimeloyl-ACP methyl ester carboxylesterase